MKVKHNKGFFQLQQRLSDQSLYARNQNTYSNQEIEEACGSRLEGLEGDEKDLCKKEQGGAGKWSGTPYAARIDQLRGHSATYISSNRA
jgi:hypothetical protein